MSDAFCLSLQFYPALPQTSHQCQEPRKLLSVDHSITRALQPSGFWVLPIRGNWQKERKVRIHFLPSLFLSLSLSIHLLCTGRDLLPKVMAPDGYPLLQLPHSPWVPGTSPSPNPPSSCWVWDASPPLLESLHLLAFLQITHSWDSPMTLSRVPSVSCNDHDQHWASVTFLAFVSIHQAVHSLSKESKLEKNKPIAGCTALHNSWNNEGIAAKKIKESCFTVYITNRGSGKGTLRKVGMLAVFRVRDNHGLSPAEGLWVTHNRLKHAQATILPFLMKRKNLASSGN